MNPADNPYSSPGSNSSGLRQTSQALRNLQAALLEYRRREQECRQFLRALECQAQDRVNQALAWAQVGQFLRQFQR